METHVMAPKPSCAFWTLFLLAWLDGYQLGKYD